MSDRSSAAARVVHRLDAFGIDDLVACREAIVGAGARHRVMEHVASDIVRYLHEHLVGADGTRALPLVRLYKTHRYGDLGDELKRAAEAGAEEQVREATQCLTLLGTAGLEPGWNDRRSSVDHRAIPLTSEAVVDRSPMIADLIRQLGMDIAWVVRPDEDDNLRRHHEDYGVFFVPEAVGSPLVPAQEGFVEPYGIRSVVGCGGVLPSGDMFALVAFSTIRISVDVADLFRSLAYSVKAAIIPYTFKVFDDSGR